LHGFDGKELRRSIFLKLYFGKFLDFDFPFINYFWSNFGLVLSFKDSGVDIDLEI